MSHFLDNLLRGLDIPVNTKNDGPGRPGYAAGTATKEHMERKAFFGKLGVPEGMDPNLCLNNADHAPVPSATIFQEKPAHTIMCVLYARGCSEVEIAQETGYTPVHVKNVLAQPWAKRKVNLMMGGIQTVAEAVNHKLGGEMINTVQTVLNIRDDEKASPATRLQSCVVLMDRFLGKSTQTTINIDQRKKSELSDEDLARELAATEERISSLVLRQPVREASVTVTETHVTTTKQVTVNAAAA